eukprot:751127_1
MPREPPQAKNCTFFCNDRRSVCKKRNSFKSQYVKKRFGNKHAKSSNWRHYNRNKYTKKCMLNHKHKTMRNYFNMERDGLSDRQQHLEDELLAVEQSKDETYC